MKMKTYDEMQKHLDRLLEIYKESSEESKKDVIEKVGYLLVNMSNS